MVSVNVKSKVNTAYIDPLNAVAVNFLATSPTGEGICGCSAKKWRMYILNFFLFCM